MIFTIRATRILLIFIAGLMMSVQWYCDGRTVFNLDCDGDLGFSFLTMAGPMFSVQWYCDGRTVLNLDCDGDLGFSFLTMATPMVITILVFIEIVSFVAISTKITSIMGFSVIAISMRR